MIIHHKAKLTLIFFSILAFYCNGNCGQVDRLYRLSALFHSKWDELHENQTYIHITYNRTLSSIQSFYSPIGKILIRRFYDRTIHLESMYQEHSTKYPWSDIGAGMLLNEKGIANISQLCRFFLPLENR